MTRIGSVNQLADLSTRLSRQKFESGDFQKVVFYPFTLLPRSQILLVVNW